MTHPVGTRIYNHGDTANVEHSGTITRAWTDRWGSHYEIQIDDEDEAENYPQHRYTIPAIMVSPVYKGHRGHRGHRGTLLPRSNITAGKPSASKK